MASNFNQKDLLEKNNAQHEAKSSGFAKGFYYASFLTVFPVFYHVSKRNWFRTQKETILEQLANVDAKLTERYNVLTNQLKIAKAALKHEKDLQTSITKARAAATKPQGGNAEGVAKKNQVVGQLAAKWNMVQENYPKIATMPAMVELQETVRDIDSDLEALRRFYTAAVKKYNSALLNFPSNIVADGMNIHRFPMFEADDEKRANVSMDF